MELRQMMMANSMFLEAASKIGICRRQRDAPEEKVIVGLLEELLGRTTKKFIDFVPLC